MKFLYHLLAVNYFLIPRHVRAEVLRRRLIHRPNNAAESSSSGHGCGKIMDQSTCERFSNTCYWDFVDPNYNRPDDEARCFDKTTAEIEENNSSTAASLPPSPRPESDNVIIIDEDVVCERIIEKSTCENYSICVWEFVDPEYTRPGDEARCFDKPESRPQPIPDIVHTVSEDEPDRPSEDIDNVIHGMCARIVEKSTCEEYSHVCYWDFVDPDYTRPEDEARCFDKDICSNESSQSQADCNSIKGCSWLKGEARCAAAPSHQTCSAFQKRKTCEASGCLSLKTKKKRGKVVKECVGRWEHNFLSTLKGKTESQAKQALEDEFGRDTYTLVVVKKGKQAASRKKQWDRIRIYLNKKGKIKKTPRFG